jgi:NADPH:quinone reductase-like Zn-dependent oxidoreductase
MRAVVLRDGKLEVRETPDPIAGPGQMLIRTVSTAICASDVHFMDHHDAVPVGGPAGMVYDPNRDIVLGHEFVGDVVAHGPNCSGAFPVGTRVTAMPVLLADDGVGGMSIKVIGQHPEAPGSFGELFLVSEAMARAVPAGVDPDAVALVDAFAVGEFYVRSAAVDAGDVPIVVGAGAIGLSTVVALASRGIEPIIVSDFKPERRALAERFGAHVLVDPARTVAVRGVARAPARQTCRCLRVRRRAGPSPADRELVRDVDADLCRRRVVPDRLGRLRHGDAQGRRHPVRRRPSSRRLVRHLRRRVRRPTRSAALRRRNHHPRRTPRCIRRHPARQGAAEGSRSPEQVNTANQLSRIVRRRRESRKHERAKARKRIHSGFRVFAISCFRDLPSGLRRVKDWRTSRVT